MNDIFFSVTMTAGGAVEAGVLEAPSLPVPPSFPVTPDSDSELALEWDWVGLEHPLPV